MNEKKAKFFDFELSAPHEHAGEQHEAGAKLVLTEDQCKKLESLEKGKRLGEAKAPTPEAAATASA